MTGSVVPPSFPPAQRQGYQSDAFASLDWLTRESGEDYCGPRWRGCLRREGPEPSAAGLKIDAGL